MKIAWIVNNINQVGGIEQVVCGLSQYFSCELNHNVEIISINTMDGRPFFPLHESVKIRHCGLHWKEQTTKKLRVLIRRTLRDLDADILLTCHGGITAEVLMAKHLFRGKIVATQHSACDSFSIKQHLRNIVFYRFADAFVVLTKTDQNFYKKAICKSIVIPNAILSPVSGRTELQNPMLIAAGRLTKIKGFDMLIEAFSQVAAKYPEWKLCICGDGELMNSLKQHIAEKALADRVLLPGFVRTTDYMRNASAFVLPSRSEGFSLVLVEALAHGLPVAAFDLPAVGEICNGQGVLTAPSGDVSALAECLDQLMGSAMLRHQLSEQASEVSQKYSVENVAEKWMQLFYQLLNT